MDGKCCDNCKWYKWYWDRCTKWNCECDARERHSCFEETVATWKDVRETLEELKQAVEEMRKASKALLEEVSKPWIV